MSRRRLRHAGVPRDSKEEALWRRVADWYYRHGFLCATYEMRAIRWAWRDPARLLDHLRSHAP